MGVKDFRLNYRPFEYPQVMEIIEAINSNYWVHKEVPFSADLQDYNAKLPPHHKTALIRTLLTIVQTEVAVKPFWGDLYHTYPKPELNGLGVTIAEDEFRHSEAYFRLAEILGLSHLSQDFLEIPIFREKIEFINKFMNKGVSDEGRLLFFSLVIENSILFGNFATVLSFAKFDGIMPNVANLIKWTSIDEQWHANAGILLLNILQEEGTKLDKNEIHNIISEAIAFEEKFVDWVFEEGELPHFTKKNLIDYIKFRSDIALKDIGMEPMYNISKEDYQPMAWFNFEVFGETYDDFFAHRVTTYTKHDKPITIDDLYNEQSQYLQKRK